MIRNDMQSYGWEISTIEKSGTLEIRFSLRSRFTHRNGQKEIKNHRNIFIDSLSELLMDCGLKQATNLLKAMCLQKLRKQRHTFCSSYRGNARFKRLKSP